MSEMLKVDPDLVRAPGVQIGLQPGCSAQPFAYPPACPRLPPCAIRRCHSLAVRWMPSNRRANFAFFARHFATNDCEIYLFQSASGELFSQSDVGGVIL